MFLADRTRTVQTFRFGKTTIRVLKKWNFSRNGDGSYNIVNAASGKALDVKDGAASSGTNIQQWSRNGSAAQRWFIDYVPGGFKLSSALNGAFVIDVSGGNSANGTNVTLHASNDSRAQRFTFRATTYVQPLPADQQAMYNRAQWYNSNTEWLILTDTVGCRTGIFRGSRGNLEALVLLAVCSRQKWVANGAG